MPLRDRGARDRFMRQTSLGGAIGFTSGPLFHHATRRSSVQDTAALRNRRRSTLRRQTARELIAEEEEDRPDEPKSSTAVSFGCDRRRKSISQQVS